MTMGLYDYTAGDYLVLNFKSNDTASQYLLAGSYLGLTYSATINGVAVGLSTVNSTAVKLLLTASTLPTAVNSILKVALINVVNPPFASQLWLDVNTREQASNGLKETLRSANLTVTVSSLTASSLSAYLLANNSLTLTLSNPYRNLLNSNGSIPQSTLSLVLPAQLTCPSLSNGSLSLNWYAGVTTSGSNYNGNTTQLVINLGTCYAFYFANTVALSVS
jgi:hypothetical protein